MQYVTRVSGPSRRNITSSETKAVDIVEVR